MSDTNDAATKSTMWGGRFSSGPDAAMERFNACLEDDKRLAMEDIDGSLAHAAMLGAQGIISAAEANSIAEGLETVRGELEAGTFPWSEALEDVHMNVESRLKHHIGDVAGKLHTGRSRNDQVATDIRLWTRRRLFALAEAVRGVQRAFLAQATGQEATVLPGFTHLQIAQPITYGFYCLAYVEMFERDRQRLVSAATTMDACPLGGAALAGTPHPIDRKMTAKALGFAGPAGNAMDAVSARDFALEAVAAASICATHISRYAEEVVIYATPQFGYVTVPEAFSTGSSIMPQKRNPDAAELLRAKGAAMAGAFQALTLTQKGLTLAYSKDLQETKRPLMDSLDSLMDCLEILAPMVDGMKIHPDAMARDAGKGFATATDLADALAKEGMAFRDAHHVVGALVAAAEKRGVPLHEVPLADAQAINAQITQALLDRLTPENSVRAKQSFGSTHPDEVRAAIAKWDVALSEQ